MRALPVAVLVAVLSGAGCSHALTLARVTDAETVMRVKTALVNDPELGVLPIEVRVVDGHAVLNGGVRTEADVERALAVTRAVPGVVDARSELQVGVDLSPRAMLDTAPVSTLTSPEPVGPSFIAVGGALRRTLPRNGDLAPVTSIGPLVRVGAGSGLGLSIGFNWTRTDLSAPGGGGSLGCLRVRPVMAGLGYTVQRERVSTTLSAVGGTAFNSLCDAGRSTGPTWALSVKPSAAWRLGVSTWIELNRRVALNVFGGYLVTSPRVTLLRNGATESYRVRADAVVLSTGLVYKVF